MPDPPPVPPEDGKDAPEPLDFDPYRFGRPDHPVPPEYAPPGYLPPPEDKPPAPVYPPSPQYPVTYPPGPGYSAGPPQYPHPYPPPPPGYPYGVPKTGNTKATVALVLGILSIVFAWTSVLDLVLIVPAIVLGALARGDARRFPERGGRGAATGGLVCGLVALVLVVALTLFVYVRIRPCLDNYEINSHGYNTCVHDKLFG